ncbi:MAG: V-type ATP synthase subunit I [Clostridia bacterium]|nr:V-type ATP synthase subunit I [Clostridia bacterium]
MKKMSLVAHKGDRSRLMRIFTKAGCVELSETPLLDCTEYPTDREKRDAIESKRLKVTFAINFLKECLKEYDRIDKKGAPKGDFKKENRLVPLEEYESAAREEIETFSKIAELEKINASLIDIKSERARINALLEQLAPYRALDVPFSALKDTACTSVFVGVIPDNRAEELQNNLPEKSLMTLFDGNGVKCIVVVCHNDEKKLTVDALTNAEFSRCPFDFDVTAEEKAKECEARLQELDKSRENAIKDAMTYLPHLSNLKVLYDYYTIEIEKFDAVQKSPHTKSAFVMDGWVPADKAEDLKNKVETECRRTEISFRDPFDDETPPTAVKNDKFTTAFSGITAMYGVPSYRERDPNLFVALFYFLIFGIMIGDAGYGLVMTIACTAFLLIKKPVKGSGNMILMFAFCGISTFIWGVLFGGWFAIKIPEGSFLNKITWFEPLEEPLKMFMLALAVGVVQIATGFALSGLAKIKMGGVKNIVKGILSDFGWVVIFIGVFLLGPKIMFFMGAVEDNLPWFEPMGQAGLYTAIAGVAMIFIGGAWGKKNPIKMVGGSLGSLYGAINVVSDLLSYSRLFGLGLTTGVIGYVMNQLATIVSNMLGGGVAWVIGVVILLVGHVFNLGINLLGAYVHDARLQHIEFFGRFYEGLGRTFRPLGNDTKYTYLDN